MAKHSVDAEEGAWVCLADDARHFDILSSSFDDYRHQRQLRQLYSFLSCRDVQPSTIAIFAERKSL